MARKKKAAKGGAAARAVPAGGVAGREGAAVLIVGGAALVLAWLALLGGLSGGRLDWSNFLQLDSLRLFAMRLDFGEFSHWIQPLMTWVPEVATIWGLHALGMDFRAVLLLHPLLVATLSAGGWILVCDFVFGKSPVRRAAVLILHALPLLLASRGALDVFYHLLVPSWRGGLWAAVPWLLLFSMRAAFSRGRGEFALFAAAAGGLAAATVSDYAAVPWMIGPAIGAALVFSVLRKGARGRMPAVAAVLVVAVPVGRMIDGAFGGFALSGATVDFSHSVAVLRAIGGMLATLAARNPLEGAAWVGFVCVAPVAVFAALRAKSAKRESCGSRESRDRAVFVALFIFGAMALSALAASTRPVAGFDPDPGRLHFGTHRHFLPLLYFPLFVGWALLPWKFPVAAKFPAVGRGGWRLTAAAGAMVSALAVPGAASVSVGGLNPYASPFHRCFAENAARLGWTAGLAHWHAAMQLLVAPDAGIERVVTIEVLRGAGGDSAVRASLGAAFNRRWLLDEFQFAAVNGFNGRVFYATPDATEPGCPTARASECFHPGHWSNIVDEGSVRAAFGEPDEIVDCAGFGFYHYDPPLRFDTPEARAFARGEHPDGGVVLKRTADGADGRD